MDYALIKNGTVQNVIVAAPDFVPLIAAQWDAIIPASHGCAIGWGWDGVALVRPVVPEEEQ